MTRKEVKSTSVHIKPDEVPDHVMKYIARDTLAAIRRFYAVPENREKFERWKAERDKKAAETGLQEQIRPNCLIMKEAGGNG